VPALPCGGGRGERGGLVAVWPRSLPVLYAPRSTDGSGEERVRLLVDEYRSQCLWFLREDYYPTTVKQTLRVLDYIERHGDCGAFQKAAELRKWLSQTSNEQSVV